MHYLTRVFKTLKKVTWEKIPISLKHMIYVLLVVIGSSLVYWGIDVLISSLIGKLEVDNMGLKQIVENNKFKVRKLEKIVNKIEALADKYSAMSDEELQSLTSKFKKELANGKTLDDLLVEAFATIREADKRVLGLYPYPVQLLGGIVLHQGNLAEMRTGEGKTLTETMPVYLNALTGIVSVKVFTSQVRISAKFP